MKVDDVVVWNGKGSYGAGLKRGERMLLVETAYSGRTCYVMPLSWRTMANIDVPDYYRSRKHPRTRLPYIKMADDHIKSMPCIFSEGGDAV